MFSGIIASVGRITRVKDRDGGLRLLITTDAMDLSDVHVGDSIAVNGICLTVVACTTETIAVDVSRETLDCTIGLEVNGGIVNLEKALRLSDRLNGHLVSGHVDGVGEVVQLTDHIESWELLLRAPQALKKYIAVKGSIAINGVSLTINRVQDRECSINIIPHTLAETNLKDLRVGSQINLEVDLIARYVERMMQVKL